MTPTRTRSGDDTSRRPSLTVTGNGGQDHTAARLSGVLFQLEQFDQDGSGRDGGGLSGSTTVEEPAEIDEGKSRDVDEIDEVELALGTEEDVKEAKTNRKVRPLPSFAFRLSGDMVLMSRSPILKSPMLVYWLSIGPSKVSSLHLLSLSGC